MFVKYVKTCLNNLGREHWYTLLEKGEILTKSGKITLIPLDDKDPSLLVIDDTLQVCRTRYLWRG